MMVEAVATAVVADARADDVDGGTRLLAFATAIALIEFVAGVR